MKYHWKDRTLRQVTQLLQAALAPLVDARVAALSPPTDSDQSAWPLIRLRDEKGRATTLAVLPWGDEVKRPVDHEPLWVLQKATKRIREELRRRDENFVDTSGAVRLHLPGILIDRSDLKRPALQGTSEVRNPYSDKNSFVARSLLHLQTSDWLTLQELAQRAGLSLASTSYVVKALERSNFLATTRTPRGLELKLTDPEGLIQEWVRQYDWTKNTSVTFAAPLGSPERFIARLHKALSRHQWALTLHAGAGLLAPHAIWDHVHFYIALEDSNDLVGLGQDLGWERSPKGKVTAMLPYYRKSVWREVRTVRRHPVVSTLQLILDLWHYPVRGREQARHLLEIPQSPMDD